jgi:hypothetical protein
MMTQNDPTILTVTGRFLGGGLFTPRAKEEGKVPEYSAALALDAGQEEKIAAAKAVALANEFGTKIPATLQDWTVREGDDPEFASYGLAYINAKLKAVNKHGVPHKRPPTYVRRGGGLVEIGQDDNIIYPGSYIALSIQVYAYPGDKAKSIKPGASITLRQALFLKDGPVLGTVLDAESDFEGLESEALSEEDGDLFK